MKNVTMISRRSFLKAAMAASAVSALAFTGCGGSASSTVAASSTASSAAASAAAEGGQTFKVGMRQLCGSCFPQPDRGICGEPSG